MDILFILLQGGVNDEITLTAYILLAICETGIDLQVSFMLRCLFALC